MAFEFILLLLVAYLLGSVPAAYLAARWSRGIDIRQYGSGNVGVANLRRRASKWLLIPTIIFDLGKGIVMVWAAQLMGFSIAQQVAVGLAAIIGHNWPVFLRFSGGRGAITTLGVALLLPLINGPLMPWEILVFMAAAGIGLLITHETPLGVGIGIATMPLVSWGVDKPLPMTLGFLAMFLLMVIRRLTAPKTSVTASVPSGELVLNRLLFDRDIRNREAWLSRQPIEQAENQKEDDPTK
jgi:glycerol-3-phosphate acyltransferase PlsY